MFFIAVCFLLLLFVCPKSNQKVQTKANAPLLLSEPTHGEEFITTIIFHDGLIVVLCMDAAGAVFFASSFLFAESFARQKIRR